MSSEDAVGYGGSYAVGAGGGGATYPVKPKGAIKKKTLEYDNLKISYDYATRELRVDGVGSSCFTFSTDELIELKAALTALGLGTSPIDGVTYR